MSPVSSAASRCGGIKGTGNFSKKKTSQSLDCLFNRLLQSSQSRHHVRAEVQADRATVALAQAQKVAERLGRFEHAERVGLARDRQVLRVIGSDLNEDSRVRPTLVQLPGGMEKARTIAERRRHLLLIPHPQPDRLQRLV